MNLASPFKARRHQTSAGTGVILIALFVLFLMAWQVVGLITDWFWYQEVGYEQVFRVTLASQVLVGFLYGGIFFFILYANLSAALRLTDSIPIVYADGVIPFPNQHLQPHAMRGLALTVALVFAFFAGLQNASQWDLLLRFINATPFGVRDPLFGRDIGFYVFRLPFFEQIHATLLTVLVISTLGSGFIYLFRRALLFIPPKSVQLLPGARNHLIILLSAIFLTAILGFWIDLASLLNAKRGVVFGAGYTQATTQVWVLKTLMLLSGVCALTLLSNLFKPSWRISGAAVLAFLAVLIIGRGFYPALVQRFMVIPNEIVLEKPYLERNIRYTRLAYGLNNIEDRVFPAENNLTLSDLKRNDLTIKNIRLWDHAPLLRTFAQIQEIRTYYKFMDVDNDRYTVNGEYRQVMLSPREIAYAALPSRTWVNEHLTYTHGYGVVMGPVNRITPEGLPEFFIKDIPPVASTNIKVTRPEIYFGEQSNEYVFVKGKRPEFDYPVGENNVYARYEGKGGVPLTFVRKLLYAARFSALTILLSDDITAETRVMYYRNIKERVARIAPFARLDPDPYLVVSSQGRLLWIVDGYTVTDRYPYAEPTERLGNYIRNSIKAVVDAYDGCVTLYTSDPDDPILKTYAKIFPGVFKALADMPEDLRMHLRYPSALMAVQARMYLAYHMQDPQVFYNKEDLWAIPAAGTQNNEQGMEPYYTIMKLPGESKEEFIMLLPFTPRNKDNMSAWMAVRCDAPHYGKVIVYNFPKQKLIYGPRQIEARIDQDTEISKQISLWNQSGSQVIRGGLLAIPIEKSILYVEPLYLAAEKGQLPELKRVITAYGNSIAMEDNLELSLQKIFGGEVGLEQPTPPSASTAPATDRTDRQLALQALEHYRKSLEHLKRGDWTGYGAELKQMDDILSSIERRP